MKLFKKSGQSTAEYAILIGLVVGVLVVMQTYVKRGIQGRFKDATEKYVTDMSSDGSWGTITSTGATLENQWEFGNYAAQRTRETLAGTETTESVSKGEEGKVKRDIVEKTKQSGDAEGSRDYQEYDYDKNDQGS